MDVKEETKTIAQKLAYNVLRVTSIAALVGFIAAQLYVGINDQIAIQRAGNNNKRSLAPEEKGEAEARWYARRARAYPPSAVPVDADSAVTFGFEGRDEGEQAELWLERRGQAEPASSWLEGRGESAQQAALWLEGRAETAESRDNEGRGAVEAATNAPAAGGRDGSLAKRQRSSTVVVIPLTKDDGYYPGSTIAKGRRGSSAFSLLSRCVWIAFAIVMVISEVELPEKWEERMPILGAECGTMWLGFFQFIAALTLLAHRLALFPYVAALILFGVGIINFLLGTKGNGVKWDRGFLSGREPEVEAEPRGEQDPYPYDDESDRASISSMLGLNLAWTKVLHPDDCTDDTLEKVAHAWVNTAYSHHVNPWSEAGPYNINSLKNERLKHFIAQLTVRHKPQTQYEHNYQPTEEDLE